MAEFANPFRPGAGHTPPHLAGRDIEKNEFRKLLKQTTILENMILTGLRGVGKTVLLEELKPLAIREGWIWVGTDLSESTSVSEENTVIRLCTDLSVVTSGVVVGSEEQRQIGFTGSTSRTDFTLDFDALKSIYHDTPGLASDKLKSILKIAWAAISKAGARGIIFAYDEAQNLSDQAAKEQYPLSLMLEAFQSVQRTGLPLMLLLTGLPTLFPKLVEARTFSERMFTIVFLDSLNEDESRAAILKPIEAAGCPVRLTDNAVDTIISMSGGYPYFIQFICKEMYDAVIQKVDAGEDLTIPVEAIQRKLDSDFFAGRWARVTDRQRELLAVIASLENCDTEFTVQDVVEGSKSRSLKIKGFSSSHANQMLAKLSKDGLVFKNRHGKYSFAVPLLGQFINRQTAKERMGELL